MRNSGSNSGQGRYLSNKIDNLNYLIADTADSRQRLYLLSVSYDPQAKSTNVSIRLGTIFMDGGRTRVGRPEAEQFEIEHLIWASDCYLRSEAVVSLLTQRILISLDQEEIEIEHPYELAYKFGGSVYPLRF